MGGIGSDELDGGIGSNELYGGAGNDYYDVTTTTNTIIEYANEGEDIVIARIANFTLPANVERLTFYNTAGSHAGTGNELDNQIEGFTGNDQLSGLGGNDILYSSGGSDTLVGGEGNDIYYVVNRQTSTVEYVNEGIDEVRVSGVNGYTLALNIENLTFIGATTNVSASGNASDNTITGTAGRDEIAGLAGNDTLNGASTVAGQEDTLLGGIGNDIYLIAQVGTSIVEYANEGIDEVRASGTQFTLPGNVENLTYTGGATTFIGIGNALDNVISGGTAYDIIVGDAGNDTISGGAGAANDIIGGAGNDVFIVQANDTIIEYAGEGLDEVRTNLASYTLRTNIENLVYTGTAAFGGVGTADNNSLTGGAGADSLSGLDGNDILIGGSGADLLIGGNGADTFRYNGGETGYDRIIDFTPGTDRISISTAFALNGTLSFQANAGIGATTANSTFVYNTTNGIVSYDADGTGNGAAVNLAQLNVGLTLTLADFERVAAAAPARPDFAPVIAIEPFAMPDMAEARLAHWSHAETMMSGEAVMLA